MMVAGKHLLWEREIRAADLRVRLAEEELDAARQDRRVVLRRWLARGIETAAICRLTGVTPRAVMNQAGVIRRRDLLDDVDFLSAQSEEFDFDC